VETTAQLTERARHQWRYLLARLGIPESLLNGKHQPCPFCGGKDRFRFTDHEGAGMWRCNACEPGSKDGFGLLMRFHGWPFREAANQVTKVLGEGSIRLPAKPAPTRAATVKAMNALWLEGKIVTIETPAGRYLNRRLGMVEFPACLRSIDRLKSSDDGKFHPGMLALISDAQGRPSHLHRTYLTEDGHKAAVETPKKNFPGTMPPGGSIRLADAEGVVGLAEGIETALAAWRMTTIPCWAATSAGMMEKFACPKNVTDVVIFGDNDASYRGHQAAYTLAARLVSEGKNVTVKIPENVGTDWADVLAEEL
jgi:putative DNA primase/helicase